MNGTVDDVSVFIYIGLVSFLPPKDIQISINYFLLLCTTPNVSLTKVFYVSKENNIVLHLTYFCKTAFDVLHSARKPGSDGMFFLLSPVSPSH